MIALACQALRRWLFASCLALLSIAAPSVQAAGEPVKPEPILVFGHRNPDTDSIVGAMAAANLLNRTERLAQAMAPGVLNPETTFVLKRFGLAPPAKLGDVAGKPIAIVDFTDALQGPAEFHQAKLVFIADHHKPNGLPSDEAIDAWIQPVGSVNTLLFELHQAQKVPVPKDLAGGMLCAILSDTVMYRSVTTTPRDLKAGAALARIAGIKDQKALGLAMFKAGSALDGATARSLVLRDYKDFNMGGARVGVGQLELVDFSLLSNRKEDLLVAMGELKQEKGLHTLLLMITDILRESTELLVVTDDEAAIQQAFQSQSRGQVINLPGVMSRKRQVIPKLEAVFVPGSRPE